MTTVAGSSRLPRNVAPNRLTMAVAAARAAGRAIVDLTESNPTRVGLPYPEDLLTPLSDVRAQQYDPQPFGLVSAREAVATDFARRGIDMPAGRICLTASTSEAYSWLFKLLCEPGDRVLVPRPSYPLFEHLTALECVEASPYELDAHGQWRIDVSMLARQIDERTKAVLLVSPNNPTGSVLHQDELDTLADVCAERGIALVGDEVFADYLFGGRPHAPSVASQSRALAFALGGLSKSVGLPQVKVAWIGVAGPDVMVSDVSAGLEIIADTFLSVSTPAQVALPHLLERGAAVREAIRSRTARNLAALGRAVAGAPAVSLLSPDGGWCAVLQVPAMSSEEALMLDLVHHDGVLVHPGYFFDFPREAFVVVSLLVEPEQFDRAVARLLARATAAS